MNDILQNLLRLQTLDFAGKKHTLAQAAGLRAGIPQGMLTNYDRARARGKKGITLLRNNVCSNCRMQVPIAVTASLMRGTVQVCGNCGLYLCLPQPEELPPATRVASPRAVRPRKKKTVA
jgi:hypothetical protein